MSDQTITLTREQMAQLRGVGDIAVGEWPTARLIRDGSGHTPLMRGDGEPCRDQVLLSDAELDLIEAQPEKGLGVADVARTTGWTIRLEAS